MLEKYEPKKPLTFFEEISRIPRGSGNEKAVSDWLVAFAKERGLPVTQDKALNVLIKKQGTKGHENAPAVIIQGHMDMVCEKNAATVHDFEKDPIKLVVDGDWLRADGTTLGADDGFAVAMALALLDSGDIPHPPLEVLITTGEEVGLLGAAEVDGGLFQGKMLLNMDTGKEGFFMTSCAGGGRADMVFPLEYGEAPANAVFKTLGVGGLKGGHSGNDITKERGNANRLLGRALKILRSGFGVRIAAISGGSKDNAIPREARAVIVFDGAKAGDIDAAVKKIAGTFRREYAASDEGLEIALTEAGKTEKVFSESLCGRLVSALLMIPNGVQAMSLVFNGLPETSLNIGTITMKEDAVVITSSLRSSVGSRKDMLVDQLDAVAKNLGATVGLRGLYPAWEYRPDSALREKTVKLYAEMFGRDPLVFATHGGLEGGIFSVKIPGVDIISFGPDVREMHTPSEHMSLSSFKRTWEFLQRLLVVLAKP